MPKAELNNLLEEMIEAASPPPKTLPSIEAEERVLPRFFNEKAHKKRVPLFPLILSLSFLGGLGFGTLFGYYWAKSTLPISVISSNASKFQEIIEPMPTLNPSLALARKDGI